MNVIEPIIVDHDIGDVVRSEVDARTDICAVLLIKPHPIKTYGAHPPGLGDKPGIGFIVLSRRIYFAEMSVALTALYRVPLQLAFKADHTCTKSPNDVQHARPDNRMEVHASSGHT